ncbi:hypothetical protein [Arthrobacter woluwensis]|uniref:hypothetical protein n=1 Tax=Arthrobacter woluwensis TaxID=156980 RepID=UPI001AAF803A|nr:hypothetical protein [Arthrobacter woluwensis]QTF71881.1 hypothetical protein G8758_07590 [Arthrobacter woluwensis]
MKKIESAHGVTIPEDSQLRREAARPAQLQDDSYAEKYDDKTLFYDVIRSGSELLMVGPPLRNLTGAVASGTFTVDGFRIAPVVTQALERSQLTRISLPSDDSVGEVLTIELNGVDEPWSVRPSEPQHDLFTGKRVLMTLQKNEDLRWITDWATYYVRTHRVNAVLLYDNGSTEYAVDDILEGLSNVAGLETVIVVAWDYKYGPQGGAWVGNNAAWDSDFCQIGAFQDARYRFLETCEGVINADVDELLVALGDTDETIFDELAMVDDGVLGFGGFWVENAPLSIAPGRGATALELLQDCRTEW